MKKVNEETREPDGGSIKAPSLRAAPSIPAMLDPAQKLPSDDPKTEVLLEAREPESRRRQHASGKEHARADRGASHAVRHGVLSKHVTAALLSLGENARTLRRLKRSLRQETNPQGFLGDLLFDRLWTAFLRLILIARLEQATTARFSNRGERKNSLRLVIGSVPALVTPADPDHAAEDMGPDLVPSNVALRDLAIVARYDARFSREFQRCLTLLLALQGKDPKEVLGKLRPGSMALEDEGGNL